MCNLQCRSRKVKHAFLCIDIAKYGYSGYNVVRSIVKVICYFAPRDIICKGVFMNIVFFGLITLAVLVLTGFVIYIILELKKTIDSLKQSVESMEKTLIPTIEELHMTLRSVRKITDDVGVVSEDVKGLSGSIREVSENVKYVTETVSRLTTNSVVHVSGLKAGIRAGFGYILKSLFEKKQFDNH